MDISGLAREPTYKLNFVGSQASPLASPFSQRRRMLVGVRCLSNVTFFENLPPRSSKMLIGVGFACVHAFKCVSVRA